MKPIKGSEWRKWDLHFHTPSSYDYKDMSVTNQQIIDGLELNGISVVAITDHHKIDVERVNELQILGKKKDITVLPGIEFLSDARGSEPIHFIGIFPENSNIGYIWKQIESRTQIRRIEGEGKKFNEVYCDLIDTAQLIKELGGLVTIHAGSKSNSIENITHSLPHSEAQKIDIARVIDFFELGKESDCTGYKQHVIPFLIRQIDRHIPLIICSDNHDIKNYVVKQNLWIKSDPTYEGLKQVIFEPELRVKIQKEKPDYKEDKLVLDHVRFSSSHYKFTSNQIFLNDNLNVIVGGKSSGKSILLYNIAKTLLPDKEFFKKENIEDKYDFRKDDAGFNFEVTTKGGFAQSMYRDDGANSILPEIKYIPQNYLIRLAEPAENKTGNALNKIIRDLINEDHESMLHYDDFIVTLKSHDRKREGLIDSYFELIERSIQLDGQLKLKSSHEILEGNIKSNVLKVEELNRSIGMTPEEINEYNELQKTLESAYRNEGQANREIKKILDFNQETTLLLAQIKSRMDLLSNTLSNNDLKEIFDTHYKSFESFANNTKEMSSDLQKKCRLPMMVIQVACQMKIQKISSKKLDQ